MGPSPLFLVPWPFVFGTDENNFFEFILDDDDAPNLFLDMGGGDDHVIYDNTQAGNGVASLLGGAGNDTIDATLAGSGRFAALGGDGDDNISVTNGGFDLNMWATIVTDGGAGDDYIDIIIMIPPPPPSSTGPAPAVNLAIDAGDGDDEVHLKYQLQKTVVTSYNFHGTGGIDLGAGNDGLYLVVDVEHQIDDDPDPIPTESFSLNFSKIEAGAGDDEVYIQYNLQNVRLTSYNFHGTGDVDLGDGNDLFFWILNTDYDDSAPPPADPIFTNFRGLIDIDAGAGDDCVIFDIVGTGPAGSGRVDLGPLQISTGDGNDEVQFGVTGEYIDSITMMNGVIDTGAGDDSVVLNDVALRNSRVDLGEGNDSLSWDFPLTGDVEVPPANVGNGGQIYAESWFNADIAGGTGDDDIAISGSFFLPDPDDAVVSASNKAYISWYSAGMRVDGGAGNDEINVSLLIVAEDIEGEALATLVVNKLRGGLKVEGGDGNDTLRLYVESDEDLDPSDAFHMRGGAGMDTFVVSKGQETVVIDDFTLGEDDLFLSGIFDEVEWDTTFIYTPGKASTGILDIDGNLIAVLQGIAPEDLTAGDVTLGEYIPVS